MKEDTKKVIELWNNKVSLKDIAEQTGKSVQNVRTVLNSKNISTKRTDETEVEEETIINSDGTQSSTILEQMTKEQQKDTTFVLKAHGYDSTAWEITSSRYNSWNTNDKVHGIQTLYASKITVKPRTGLSMEHLDKKYTERQQTYIHTPFIYKPKTDNEMREIDIMDLHFGKLAWHKEVGSDFDFKIAEKRTRNGINEILYRTKHKTFDYTLLPLGNDFFNYDDTVGMTTAGTMQDNDLRWQKMFDKGVNLCIDFINDIRQQSPVKILYIPGNHDWQTAWHLTRELKSHYRQDEIDKHNVTIDISPMARKYEAYGINLVGFTHGDKEKKRIDLVMQEEVPILWGKSLYREWHLGHMHSEHAKKEYGGLTVKNISSLTGTDVWHYKSGYVGAKIRLPFMTWNEKRGLMGEGYANIIDLK